MPIFPEGIPDLELRDLDGLDNVGGIPQAIAAGDWVAARALFAAEVRRTLQPDGYLSIDRTWGGHSTMLEGETYAEAAFVSCSFSVDDSGNEANKAHGTRIPYPETRISCIECQR